MNRDRLPRVPKLCRRRDGRCYVTDPHTKKQVYFNSDDPLGEYEDWRRLFLERAKMIAAQTASKPRTVLPGQRLTVEKLCEAYLDHARQWYVKDGDVTSEVGVIRQMCRRISRVAGHKRVDDLRAGEVESFVQQMIEDDVSRQSCNALLRRLRTMARWAVRKEVMDGGTLARIMAVPALRKGRTRAREKPPVRAVELERIAATTPHLHSVYQSMVQVQLCSAMRPGEVCRMRPEEIDTSKQPWEYLPSQYKTEHHHEANDPRRRRIFLGKKAQAILEPLLRASKDASRPLFRGPNGGTVTVRTYHSAIHYACKKHGIPFWTPNQVRHAAATEIRRRFGIEAAQDFLGHEHMQTSEIYAERSHERSRKIAEEMG